jgi:hypothetical protein
MKVGLFMKEIIKEILKFIVTYFNINVLVLCLVSSFFLINIDSKEYKRDGFKQENKFSITTAFVYIIGGFVIYISSLFIRI